MVTEVIPEIKKNMQIDFCFCFFNLSLPSPAFLGGCPSHLIRMMIVTTTMTKMTKMKLVAVFVQNALIVLNVVARLI